MSCALAFVVFHCLRESGWHFVSSHSNTHFCAVAPAITCPGRPGSCLHTPGVWVRGASYLLFAGCPVNPAPPTYTLGGLLLKSQERVLSSSQVTQVTRPSGKCYLIHVAALLGGRGRPSEDPFYLVSQAVSCPWGPLGRLATSQCFRRAVS